MHIDWFIIIVVAITIPLAWWTTWLALKGGRGSGKGKDRETGDSTSH